MANEIMIPDVAELPAYILNPELARQANEDAAFGVSAGFPPRIKMAGKNSFALVDGNGAETTIPMGQMFKGPDDNFYLKTVVLRAKKELQKVWYATKYSKDGEGQAPDCFSNDGVKPDATIAAPQCDTCANCPHNAFGSGVNDSGQATAGKACTDNKILAVFLPNKGPHSLKITPAALKNWGLYVKALTSRGILVGNVFTLIGFDQAATFPVLTFQYGGPIPETAVGKLAELSRSAEVEEIVTQRITAQASSKPAPAKAATKPAAKEKVTPIKKDEPKVEDDLGLGLEEVTKEAEPVAQAAAGAELTDDEIAAELGL
jgi:hypothetical protein